MTSDQLPGAGRTRAGHHHGSHTPTFPEAVLLGKMAYHTKQICRQCGVGTDHSKMTRRTLHEYERSSSYITILGILITRKIRL